ncbi:MvdC/MvdD family ATP grasp protein [Streptomyces sp. NL15-2K]|uniref:MvdC/MvdD family ATP grasp protein n=1 Tax=Streptomyces sp. NL15-2K TaxID=376149 RepID=UPI000FFA1ACC|nr:MULTISPECIES: hypothetical protein [Actinomycetes]WKX09406.1 hypothetical protein Q4V64_18700 [Kutzneria buriramensis]GCB49086.1 glutathione synthase/Ribosomal protein S6 modification enzyme [Streptomyces sp. NL15-2K]
MTQHLSGGPVLVVTKELDPAADLVVDELTIRHVPVMRFDTGDFPLTVSLSVEHAAAPWAGVLADEYRSVRLEEVRAVYYRRPRLPAVSEHIEEPHRSWSGEQALAGLLGTL